MSDHIYQVLTDIQHKTEIWSDPPSTLRYATQNIDLVVYTKYSQVYYTKQRSCNIHQVPSDIQHKAEIWSYPPSTIRYISGWIVVLVINP